MRGDLHVDGVNMFDTYAPVVLWIAIILLLVLSLVLGLETEQVDYINTFCEEPLGQTVFEELPQEFDIHNMVFLLQQSVYRLRQSLLNFYNHL